MDEFFAAVEKLDNPQLRGKCILVGGDPRGRGVVSTASYEARQFGCRSAMPMAQALRLCPHAIVLPVRGRRYRQISEQVFAIFDRYSPIVEPLSIDEAFLDITGCQRALGPPEQIARRIKQDIREQVGLTASVGAAPNKFLAKLASDLRKPDGLVVLEESNFQATIDPLPVRKLWGVGPAVEKQLLRLNIRTIGQLRRVAPDLLRRTLGDSAEHYQALSRGQDDRPVVPDSQAKSIGQEQTFAADVDELPELRRLLLEQVQEVARRLRRQELQARTLTLKLRYGDFTTLSRSHTLGEPADNTDALWSIANSLLERWASQEFRPLRLLGVSVSHLTPRHGRQLNLFANPQQDKHNRIDKALDSIADRFGSSAIGRGLSIRKPKP